MAEQLKPNSEQKFDIVTYGIFVFLVIVWGAAYFFMKKALVVYEPMHTALLRIAIAAISMTPLAILHIKKIPKDRWLLITISGFLGNGLPAICYMYAMRQVDSNVAGILNALTPIWTVVIGYLFFKQKISLGKTIGILLGFLGICILFLSKDNSSFSLSAYALLILLATFFYGLNLNILQRYLHDIPSRYIGSTSLLVAGYSYLLVLCIGVNGKTIMDLPFHTIEFLYIVFLGVIGTAFSNILFFMLIKRSNANFASMVTYIMPFVSIVIGYYAGEQIVWQSILCFLFILIGVWIVKKK
jgi:drug/metabolite transporter (DMT)-like permease